jgi:SAM-dependent methyltransferase
MPSQTPDPFAQFKSVQREGWSLFAPLEAMTTPAAALLVDYARIQPNHRVLDVACGTGVVAITAAQVGAKVSGLDLSPALLEKARSNASVAGVNVDFTEGDVEYLPYEDASFDVVVSQYGHMFAPRPEIAVAEMLRVLKPGGTIAFSTWPPEMFIGKMFALVAQYIPPPAGVAPPPLWGDPNVIRERLKGVSNLEFDRQVLMNPSLSPKHSMRQFESTAAPLIKLNEMLSKEDPTKLEKFRKDFQSLISTYRKNNQIHQHFLMTRGTK